MSQYLIGSKVGQPLSKHLHVGPHVQNDPDRPIDLPGRDGGRGCHQLRRGGLATVAASKSTNLEISVALFPHLCI